VKSEAMTFGSVEGHVAPVALRRRLHHGQELHLVWSDAQIAALLADPKGIVDPAEMLQALRRATPQNSSRQHSRDVVGQSGATYRLILRQGTLDSSNFSVILGVVGAGSRITILRRHNGTSHSHRNHIEGTSFANVCHIHIATERYQDRGFQLEHFAEVTEAFYDLATALAFMLAETNFERPSQLTLDSPS
jgi:hypothetical protein